MNAISLWALIGSAITVGAVLVVMKSLVLPSSYAEREKERKELRRRLRQQGSGAGHTGGEGTV